jgi:hypothetical protein
MPPVKISKSELKKFGAKWQKKKALSRSSPYSSGQLGELFDRSVGKALAAMLGGIDIESPKSTALLPEFNDCVEVGPVRIVGGVRPQNFDVGYRPDGVRFAFDSKTLNDTKSIGKNWQNMINDLATEATTVHTRFPHAVVAFLVAYPKPAVTPAQVTATVGTLERLGGRRLVDEDHHRAEGVAFVLWDPKTGQIDPTVPAKTSPLRIERLSEHIETTYVDRYKGLPPHAA